nr:hypothetical protein OG781_37810 [Streptomyces sp. NBC_00830]
MSRLFLLLPVAVAAMWFVQRYREGAFNRTKRPRLPTAAPTQPAAAPAWVYRPEDYGLVPDEHLDTRLPGPDPELVKALEAASAGDWAPASDLLAASDPEWRWIRLTVLASAAAEDDSWVRAWRAARPGDAAAVLVGAESLVALAWKLRGNRGANDTTREQFENFHRMLAQASGALAEAARLAPADPCPYIAMIRVALGEGWAHEHMHALWREVVIRAPHHVGAHSAALQYWCAKWRGSDEQMHAFAESAVGQAPAGSLLPVLRLIALFEELNGEQISHPRYQSAEATAAIDALFADIGMAPPGHPWLPAARHLLVWFLRAQRRTVEAAEQLRLVDGFIGALPWRYYLDPVAFYGSVRQNLVLAAAHLTREAEEVKLNGPRATER